MTKDEQVCDFCGVRASTEKAAGPDGEWWEGEAVSGPTRPDWWPKGLRWKPFADSWLTCCPNDSCRRAMVATGARFVMEDEYDVDDDTDGDGDQ